VRSENGKRKTENGIL